MTNFTQVSGSGHREWATLRLVANVIELEMSAWAAAVDARVEAIEQRWQVFSALVVLNVLDVLTTGFVLSNGGTERNPFVQPIVDNLLHVGLLKVAMLGLVGGLLTRCRDSRITDVALIGATGWYVAVVGWNAAVMALI